VRQLDVLVEFVRLASAAREQCFTWGPQQHESTHDRIITAAMRYSAVVNYAGTVEIPLLPRHLASSSSSASIVASQPTPPTLASGFSAPTTQQQPQAQGPHTYVQQPFLPPVAGTFSGPYFQLMHAIIVCLWLYYILIAQGNRLSFRQPGLDNRRRQHPQLSIFLLGGSRLPAFQFPAADIPSSSTRPMFQPAFDTTTEDQLGWDQMA
jgi:hypothetical protein